MTTSHRYQAVLVLNGQESDHWTDYEEVAISIAKGMRERNPDARVVLYDHYPTATEF